MKRMLLAAVLVMLVAGCATEGSAPSGHVNPRVYGDYPGNYKMLVDAGLENAGLGPAMMKDAFVSAPVRYQLSSGGKTLYGWMGEVTTGSGQSKQDYWYFISGGELEKLEKGPSPEKK